MFANDNPEHRQLLVERLIEKGIPAFEWDSGGGILHVIVPLAQVASPESQIHAINDDLKARLTALVRNSQHNPYLFIATNSLRTNCEVGLFGEDPSTGDEVSSTNWPNATDVEQALNLFAHYWLERDKWLTDWAEGKLSK